MRKAYLILGLLLFAFTAHAQIPSQYAKLIECQPHCGVTNCYTDTMYPSGSGTATGDCTAHASPADSIPSLYDGTDSTVYIDPVFGTKIERITPQAGMTAGDYEPVYAPYQHWSKNSTYLTSYGPSGAQYLYSGIKPYTYIRKINFVFDGADQPWLIWSTTQDCYFLTQYQHVVERVDVCNSDTTTNMTVTPTTASGGLASFITLVDTMGNSLDMISGCETSTCFIKPFVYCNTSDDDTKFTAKIVSGPMGLVYGFAAFQYDIVAQTVQILWFHKLTSPGDLVQTSAPQNKRPAWACISGDGDYMQVAWNTSNTFTHYGTEEYRVSDGAFMTRSNANGDLTLDEGTHSDWMRLLDGTEAIITGSCSVVHNDFLRLTASLADPTKTSTCTLPTDSVSVWLTDDSYNQGQWHISARQNIGSSNPMNGWAIRSSYNNNCVDGNGSNCTAIPFGSELDAIRVDGTNETRRIAHLQSCRANDYFAEPHASPNRDGTKILFGSNWRDCSGTGAKNLYIVELSQGSSSASGITIKSGATIQ